jgi:hypothetical protein
MGGKNVFSMRDASDADREDFQIGHHWTCIFRKQQRTPIKDTKTPRRVDDDKGDMQSATRMMREAKTVEKSSDGASKAAAQGKGEQRGKNRTETRTTAPGASRTSRVTVGSLSRFVE